MLRATRPGTAAIAASKAEALPGNPPPRVTMVNIVHLPRICSGGRKEWHVQFIDIFNQITALRTPPITS